MKLLFIFTGGTIGSTVQCDFISTDSAKPYLLIQAYKERFGLVADYDAIQPYTELSENNTGETIQMLIESVMEQLSAGYDGIIVTHGTDTLQYSAAALAYATAGCDIPICLVSSNRPIEHPQANGLANLHGAIRFIEQVGTPGVWVSYQNPGDVVKIHRGTRLLGAEAFSEYIRSIYDSYYGWFDDKFEFQQNETYGEKIDEQPALCGNVPLNPATHILRIEPYPGMHYPQITTDVNYILHGTFHSGTINTKSETIKDFFLTTHAKGIKTYLVGVSSGISYESTKWFDELYISPLHDISPVAAYVKLWMSSAFGLDVDAIMQKSLAGDIVPL